MIECIQEVYGIQPVHIYLNLIMAIWPHFYHIITIPA